MRSTSVLRAVLAMVAAAVLAATMLSTVSSASAEPDPIGSSSTSDRTAAKASCNWRAKQCWGAISFNKATGRSGYATDRRTKDAAINDAVHHCKNRPANEGFKSACVGPRKKNTYVRNGCLAVAFRYFNTEIVQWTKGTAFNRKPAQKAALNALQGPGERYVSAYVCTTRRD